jgi:ABC-type branched-subunit amino acid transport system substrate-binding protein
MGMVFSVNFSACQIPVGVRLAFSFGEHMGFHKMAKFAKKAPVSLLVLALLAVPACSVKPKEQDYVIIGAIFPRGGDSYFEGINAVNGIHVAREEINSSGGILAKNLDVIVLLANDQHGDALYQYAMLKAKGADAIITLTTGEIAAALKQAAEQDGMPLVGLTLPPPHTLSRTSSERTNSNYIISPSINSQSHNNATFVNKYTSLFHFEPTKIASVSYDITHMFCQAIKKAGNTSKDEIISAINEIQLGEQ